MNTAKSILASMTSIAAALQLAGCATSGSSVTSDYRIQPPQPRVEVNAPLESRAVTALQNCVEQAVRQQIAQRHLADTSVAVSFFDNDTNSTMMPAKMQTVAVSTVAALGLRPINLNDLPISRRDQLVDIYKSLPTRRLIHISGALTGFDPLLQAERDTRNLGIGMGGGRGLASFQVGDRREFNVGAVTAHTNIAESMKGDIVSHTVATARATSDFMMIVDGYNLVGSVAIGLGGGVARETSRLVGAQQAAEYATRAAILGAVTDYFKLNNAGVACWQHKG